MNESTNVFYEGLPMGCDSAKVIPLTDELSSFITSLDNEKEDTPSLILFYYGRDKVLVKSNDYQTKAIKLYAEGQVSQELEIREIVKDDEIGKIYSIDGKVIGKSNASGEIIPTSRGDSSWIDCVDKTTDDTANGKYGTTAKVLYKICSGCGVAAAAVSCLF